MSEITCRVLASFSLLSQFASMVNADVINAYQLDAHFAGPNFFDSFDFFTDPDPTHGFVTYTNATTASSLGLISVLSNNSAYIGVDHTSTISPFGSGRASVRIASQKTWTQGLFIVDLAHMPASVCGTWPALWMVGPNWPDDGEIDIIEGVNTNQQNLMSLHTSSNCSITTNKQQHGKLQTSDCDASVNENSGCGILSPFSASYGTGFDRLGGGVYALEWTSSYVKIWLFPKGVDLVDLEPGNWGTPLANFQGDCDIRSHFKDMQIVFDITFCGDWAGNMWSSSSCATLNTNCVDYVAENPKAFAESYWEINSVAVYTLRVSATSSQSVSISTSKSTSAAKSSPSQSSKTSSQVISSSSKSSSSSIPASTAIITPLSAAPPSPTKFPITTSKPLSSTKLPASVSTPLLSDSHAIEADSHLSFSSNRTTESASSKVSSPSQTATPNPKALPSTSDYFHKHHHPSIKLGTARSSSSQNSLIKYSKSASNQPSHSSYKPALSSPIHSSRKPHTPALITDSTKPTLLKTSNPKSITHFSLSSTFPSPSNPQQISPFTFLGCLPSTHILLQSFTQVHTSTHNTLTSCLSSCTNYTYAAVYSQQCVCGQGVDLQSFDQERASGDRVVRCDLPCPGDREQACGGGGNESADGKGEGEGLGIRGLWTGSVRLSVYWKLNLEVELVGEAESQISAAYGSAAGIIAPSPIPKVYVVTAAGVNEEVYTTSQAEVVNSTIVPTPGCVIANGSGMNGNNPVVVNGTVLSSEGGGKTELRWTLGVVLGVLGFVFWAL